MKTYIECKSKFISFAEILDILASLEYRINKTSDKAEYLIGENKVKVKKTKDELRIIIKKIKRR